jgi:hypothetical protein
MVWSPISNWLAHLMLNSKSLFTLLFTTALTASPVLSADQPTAHQYHHHMQSNPVGSDSRVAVTYPKMMYEHTLANMRNHLETLNTINEYLAAGEFQLAATLAEKKLGMSSLGEHGAHEASKYMPKGMAQIGTQMHRSASQFAVVAQDASVTSDYRSALKALSKVTNSCVACHAAYKFKPSGK